jgi:uncharacterized protein YecE (DUF72 family)
MPPERHESERPIRVGCAGWSIPKAHADRFPAVGSHLTRHAARLPAVEINSSFYRPHRPATYARWAAGVPDAFRFAVKVPRDITHVRRLKDATEPLARFLAEATTLGPKLGPLLVQLPPSLTFSAGTVGRFFTALRERFAGAVVLEPRHPSWFTAEGERLLESFRVARVAADPAVVPAAGEPGGWEGLAYYRLHGSPKVYYSDYAPAHLDTLAERIRTAASGAEVWCVFDNTAEFAATANALDLLARLRADPPLETVAE